MKNRIVLMSILLCTIIGFIACQNSKKMDSDVEDLPYYSDASFTPHWMNKDDSELEDFHKISSFSFTNQEGEEVTEQTFNNKIYVTDFFFTVCPGICPKMMDNMTAVQEEFLNDEDVLLLSHSVTPRRDSVPVLKAYAEEKGMLSHKWHLVTGQQSEIYKMGRLEYFIEEDLGEDKDVDDFLHTENFVLVDQNKHIRGIYNGLNMTSVNQLIDDIKLLKSNE